MGDAFILTFSKKKINEDNGKFPGYDMETAI